jgi:hypothetical protein
LPSGATILPLHLAWLGGHRCTPLMRPASVSHCAHPCSTVGAICSLSSSTTSSGRASRLVTRRALLHPMVHADQQHHGISPPGPPSCMNTTVHLERMSMVSATLPWFAKERVYVLPVGEAAMM